MNIRQLADGKLSFPPGGNCGIAIFGTFFLTKIR